ncbi:maleate cis-trans isomerase family protein [Segeticoccus rhizosphaerae]|jgi:maleate cis-trans isomerase|uniref:maleate cis-trans isomerase family protein n=1 Tax=Segeticoccus rhizosphaerae TaxID=1104777 RepID=UPI0010C135FE|nr:MULTISPECIES: maleate cis-trans isomerase [Intrasporangiaceae]
MSTGHRNTPPTVGLLYPGHSAEDDFPMLEKRLDGALRLPLVHTSVGEDAHEVGALLDLGGPTRLAEGARQLLEQSPDSVMWACTSGSFVFGWDGARKQVDELSHLVGLPTSSTSIAFVEALKSVGLQRVSVAASYPEDVAQRFVGFLQDGGFEVTAMGSHGIYTAAEVGTLADDQVVGLVRGADREGADAVLVPDTAMHTLGQLDALEEAAGIPVLTANQVTIWEGLRLLGPVPELPEMGSLFR